MVEVFKQVNKVSSVLVLYVMMIVTGCECDNKDAGAAGADVLTEADRPSGAGLESRPDAYAPTPGQVYGEIEKKDPIIINGQGSVPMSLINQTGRAISTQELTVEVQAANSFAGISSPLKQLTLGKATGVNNRATRLLSSISDQAWIQPGGTISFNIQNVVIDPRLASSSFHFHLIVTGEGLRTIDQEVIWNP